MKRSLSVVLGRLNNTMKETMCFAHRSLSYFVMCLDMNRLILIFLLLASCSGEQPDYSWFDGEWISDTEASIAINPEYSEFDEETIQIYREIYGKIKWIIREDTLRFIDDRYNLNFELEIPFAVEPIDSESFQMVMPEESYIIWNTGTGFCKVLSPDHLARLEIEDENAGLECFRLSGT